MSPLVTPTAFLPAGLRPVVFESSKVQYQAPAIPRQEPQKVLSAAEVEEIRALRAEGISKSQLAKQFNTTPFFVSLAAPVDKPVRDAASARLSAIKAGWSERKTMFREIRQIRRNDWGLT